MPTSYSTQSRGTIRLATSIANQDMCLYYQAETMISRNTETVAAQQQQHTTTLNNCNVDDQRRVFGHFPLLNEAPEKERTSTDSALSLEEQGSFTRGRGSRHKKNGNRPHKVFRPMDVTQCGKLRASLQSEIASWDGLMYSVRRRGLETSILERILRSLAAWAWHDPHLQNMLRPSAA